jgi:hypothetical protein
MNDQWRVNKFYSIPFSTIFPAPNVSRHTTMNVYVWSINLNSRGASDNIIACQCHSKLLAYSAWSFIVLYKEHTQINTEDFLHSLLPPPQVIPTRFCACVGSIYELKRSTLVIGCTDHIRKMFTDKTLEQVL